MSPIPLVTNPMYSFEFDKKHRFPMEKFRLLQTYLQEIGIAVGTNVFVADPTPIERLELAHDPQYIQRFLQNDLTPQELRRMGLPWTESLVQRSRISPNGTFLAAKLALTYGIGCHLAGGTHHSHYDFASGFCIFNDLAVTALALLQQQRTERILIFDCDVHQGDGTARILADQPNIFTCSIHCENNFPVRKARSDLDIGLDKGMEDQEYLQVVEQTFLKVVHDFDPTLILYDAGIDVFEGDSLGYLKITEKGIRLRDSWVLQECRMRKIPVATVIGGGYDKDRKALARRHAIVIEEANRIFS